MGKSKKNKSKASHRNNQRKNTNRTQFSTASSSVDRFGEPSTSQNNNQSDRNVVRSQNNVYGFESFFESVKKTRSDYMKVTEEYRLLAEKFLKLSVENSQLKFSNKDMTKMNGELRDRARVTSLIWSGYVIDSQSKDAEKLDEKVRIRVKMTKKLWNDIKF